MKKYIHVSQERIRSNKRKILKGNPPEPVLTVETFDGLTYGFEILFKADSKIVYSPLAARKGGAKVWVETEGPIIIDGEEMP